MKQTTKHLLKAIDKLQPMLDRRLKFYTGMDRILAQIKVCAEVKCSKPEHLQELAERFLSIAKQVDELGY